MKKLIYIFIVSFPFFSFSQDENGLKIDLDVGPGNLIVPEDHPEASVIDGVYQKKDMLSKRRPAEYEYVREADYVWGKRTWSYIDLREKINQPYLFPTEETQESNGEILNGSQGRYSLFLILRTAMLKGDITPYVAEQEKDLEKNIFFPKKDGDAFKYPVKRNYSLSIEEDKDYEKSVLELIGEVTFGEYYNKETPEGKEVYKLASDPTQETTDYELAQKDEFGNATPIELRDTIKKIYAPNKIIKYYLKEDWYFDKERSVFKPRIIGIAPVIYDVVKQKERALCWLYFPQIRQTLKNYYSYNAKNDAQWMSFDDLFWKRKFNSIVYKESNGFDRSIEQYRFGADALYESKKIKDKMRDFEHDVWNF